MTVWVLFASWSTAVAAEVDLAWSLTVDGESSGEHTVHIRDLDSGVHVVESYIEVTAPGRRPAPENWTRHLPWNWGIFRPWRPPVAVYQHRLTATRVDATPAVHSVLRTRDRAVEVQGRPSGDVWRLTVTDGAQSRPVTIPDVTFTSLDLLDPGSAWRDAGGANGRMLDLGTAEVLRGQLVRVGTANIELPDGSVPAEHWEWRAGGQVWRLYYTTGGALLRYETTLGGRDVQADLKGGAPVLSDEFDVPLLPTIESIEVSG